MYTFSISMPGNSKSVSHIDHFCDHCLSFLNYSQQKKILFAIHEAVINSVAAHEEKYGYFNNEIIHIDIHANEEQIVVKVIDRGDGINEKKLKNINKTDFPDIFAERGRGIFFMKHYSDDIHFDYINEKQFCVTLFFNNTEMIKSKM